MARIGITGATGFIGRRLVIALRNADSCVVPISRYPSAVGGLTCKITPEPWSVESLSDAFAGCDVVIHLAAIAHTSATEAEFLAANRDLTEKIAIAARESGVKRLVMVSSIGVNGSRTHGKPFSSINTPTPEDAYAISKWEAERRAWTMLQGSQTQCVVLRPPLIYGPGCPGNFRKLMSLARRLPLVPLGGLRKGRSFMYVDNLCDAIHIAALDPSAAGKTYVLSDGVDTTVADVARSLVRGYSKDPRCVIDVPADLLKGAAALFGRSATFKKLADELLVDPSDFMRDTGWTPRFTPNDALELTARTERLSESGSVSA